jgi:hypothetical protein
MATAKLDDGYIKGVIHSLPWKCDRCQKKRCVTVRIEEVTLDGIDRNRTILKDVNFIGVTCGCYAKFHRQVTHIQEAMKRAQR